VDQADFAQLVLDHAVGMAAERADAELHVVGVLETGHRPRERDHRHDASLEELEVQLRARVEEALESLGSLGRGSLRIRVHARLGAPHEQILELASECRADLIVLGRHGAGGTDRRHTGSVAALVLGDARCPVTVLSPIDYGDPAETEDDCAACVAVRRDSSGERWFCAAHATEYHWRSSWMDAGQLLRDEGVWF
jgi:nucleotide-binding universal stress UspA family protein